MRAVFNDSRVRSALVALVTLLLAGGTVVVLVDSDNDGKPDRTITIKVPSPLRGDAEVEVDRDQRLEPAEQREVREGEQEHVEHPSEPLPGLHEDMRDETPPGVPPAVIEQGEEETEELAEEQLVEPQQPGGAQAYSCPSAYVANQSSLSGPRVGVALHFTVSSPGSLDAIRNLFNTPSFGASSNYGIELNGRCQTWVPESRKAWTQGAANSAYVSIEIVTYDLTRAQWLAAPIIKRGILAALVRDSLKRTGAPAKLVNPVGCTWLPGVTDHNRLECGNDHWDVGDNFPWSVFMRQVRSGVADKLAPLTKSERELVRKRCAARRALGRAEKGSATYKRRLAVSQRYKAQVLTQMRMIRKAALAGSWKTRKRGARYKKLRGYYAGTSC